MVLRRLVQNLVGKKENTNWRLEVHNPFPSATTVDLFDIYYIYF